MGYVYFIREGNGTYYKVGLTKGKKESRITGLQTGNARPLYLYGYIEYADDVIVDRESQIHRELSVFAIRGEWFGLRSDFVDQFINKREGVITRTADLVLPPPAQAIAEVKNIGKKLIPVFIAWGLALPAFIYFVWQVIKIAVITFR